jgi:hypothetical protein
MKGNRGMPYVDRPLPDDFEVPAIAPRKKHLFGPDRPSPGKPKGVVAKITRNLKEGIINGAAEHGFDGEGKGGLDGYLQMCATKYPKHYMLLLARLLPHVIKGDGVGNVAVGSITITTVPSGFHLTGEHIARMSPRLEIEHEPQPEPQPQPEQVDDRLDTEAEPAPIEPEPEPETYMERLRREALEAEARGEAVVMRDPGKVYHPRRPSWDR